MDRLHRFRDECLSHLEGETDAVPSLDGMTPQERERGRRWLRDLGRSRDLYELVEALRTS
jgi:hypothetical protein